mmetsp:Transcript_32429/g.49615  ORF Transcript_32429/g.49615 Transcript_32429/m.49615 type:complete len:161 (-) Transcript_32429:14-496(-)
MVLLDESNALKSFIMIKGLVKKKGLFQTTYEPNVHGQKGELIEGIIYKVRGQTKKLSKEIEKLSEISDMDFELAKVSGAAIDKPIIQNYSYSEWKGVQIADPIPTELALPSDIRFREDIICLKKGEGAKGKVWKGKLTAQQKKELKARKEKEKAAATGTT